MSDFSVNKAYKAQAINKKTSSKTEYSSLKADYLSMKKKLAKSDFANAPVMLSSELEMLAKLKALATKGSLDSELKWIETRETEIKQALETNKSAGMANAYYKPLVSFGKKEVQDSSEQTELFNELMELCKKSDGTFDPNAEKMLSALSKNDIGLLMVVEILKHAKLEGKDINPNYTNAIVQIADAGVKNADIYAYIDAFTVKDKKGVPNIDLVGLGQALALTKAGMYADGAIKLSNYMDENWADKAQVKSSIMKLHKLGVAPDSIKTILSELAVEDVVTGEKTISAKALKTVCDLKKTFTVSRENETKERQNPINLLDTTVFELGKRTLIMKKGKVTYASPLQDESFNQAKQKYDSMVSSVEDMTLVDFVSRYKDKNGEIDSKYLRVAISLRNAGVVYNQVLDMIDSCIDEKGSINSNRLASIVSLKKAGALSDDIHGILSACLKNPDGTYIESDIKDACALTEAVIGGKEVCAILDMVRNSSEAKEFVVQSSPYFLENTNLIELLNLAKGDNPSFEENAFEVLSDLQYALISDSSNMQKETEFMSDAKEIIALARGKDGVLSDEAAGICAILCQNGVGAENIKTALQLCQNQEKDIDAKLSEILWRMGVENSSFEEIETILKVCKDENSCINSTNADMILSLFESGYSKDKILSLVKK